MIFINDSFGLINIIFSGLRSQWIILCFFKKDKQFNSCSVNLLNNVLEKPLNLFALSKSNKLKLNNSKTMHKCLRKLKKSIILTK